MKLSPSLLPLIGQGMPMPSLQVLWCRVFGVEYL